VQNSLDFSIILWISLLYNFTHFRYLQNILYFIIDKNTNLQNESWTLDSVELLMAIIMEYDDYLHKLLFL